MLKKKLKILVIIMFYSALNIFAQNIPVSLEHFSINDGLSQNSTNFVFQDSRGYIWIGTQDGLNKYDGYSFTTYRHVPDDKNSISSNYVRQIIESSDSCLWIATQNGLNKYDFRTGKFDSFNHNPNDLNSLHSNDIKAMLLDNLGVLWLKTDQGLDMFDFSTKKFKYNKHEFDEFSNASDYNYYTIVDDNEGFLWMGSKDGLISYDRVNQQFRTFKIYPDSIGNTNEVFCIYINSEKKFLLGSKNGLFIFDRKTSSFKNQDSNITEPVRVLFEDNRGVMWLGTENGLMYIDSKTKKPKKINTTKNSFEEIKLGRITSIFQDNSNILWITSDKGLFKIDRKSKKFKLYTQNINEKLLLSSERIYSIYKDQENNLWLGTRKFGLNILNIEKNTLKIYSSKTKSGIKDDNIHCVYCDKDNNILIGTSNGAYKYNKETDNFTSFSKIKNLNIDHYFANNRISDILHDSNGNYWFVTFNGLLFVSKDRVEIFKNKKNSPHEIGSNELLKIIERKDKSIWIATANGVSKFVPQSRDFINFNRDNSHLSINSTLTIFESVDGTLWVGTETGLNKFDDSTNKFQFFTVKSHGFSNDYIYTIIEDKNRYLWMSTNKGIIKFNPFTQEVVNFNLEDGLQSYEFNIGSVFRCNDGQMLFGGVNGFNSFYPDSLVKNPHSPMPLISKFIKKTAFGEKEVLIGNNNIINLAYDERSFDIYFSLPEYTHPRKNNFKYRIKEIDAKWINNGNKNYAGFIRLNPGEYTFELEASNSDNQWNYTPLVVKIIIASPWWRTRFAFFMYMFLAVILVIGAISTYNRSIRKENRILQEKNRASREVALQKEELAIKNQNISDSIRYAKRIIVAMMPTEKFFKRLLPQSFVLFKPKDIVSGDFYWIDEKDGKIYVAAVDCTGHGVPGAFMSIIGLDLLRNILSLGIETPADILAKLNSEVANIFMKEAYDHDDDFVRDGMDISICAVDINNRRVEYAGAINPLYLIRNDNIIEIKGDRVSIGPAEIQQRAVFKNHVIDVMSGDALYMFTDGYVDQFGGSTGKKYKYRRFRHLLLNIYQYDVEKQKMIIEEVIESWRGENEQVDDILVIGIKPL